MKNTYLNIAGIYMIQSISKPERIYIGSAVNIRQRWNSHSRSMSNNMHHSPQLQRHYNKYGREDLEFSILESGIYLDKNHLLSREQGWYIPYGYKNANGLPYFNIQPMAGSPLGVKRSDETKLKYSKAKKGKDPWNKGIKTGIPAWNSGKIGVQIPWNKGKKATLEAILHQSESHKGISQSQETIKNRTEGQKIPILQYDLNMVFIQEWDSTIGASKNLLINQNSIRKVLNGTRLSVGGFIWKRK